MDFPNIVNAYEIARGGFNDNMAGLPDGRVVPARPLGFASWRSRLKAAWLVFTGRADALVWPGQ